MTSQRGNTSIADTATTIGMMRAGVRDIGAAGTMKRMIADLVIVVDIVPEVLPGPVRVRLITRDPADALMSEDIDHEDLRPRIKREQPAIRLHILETDLMSDGPGPDRAHRTASQRSHPANETMADVLRTDIGIPTGVLAGLLHLQLLLLPMLMPREQLDWRPCSRMQMSSTGSAWKD